MKPPKEIVKEGYNHLSTAYREHFEASHTKHYPFWLNTFLQSIPPGSRILELGCADGIPVAQRLSAAYAYRGVDISPVQIKQARLRVPEGYFEVSDMTELSFPADSFEGIVALYSIIHVPVEQQPALIRSLYQWLAVGGYLLCTVGTARWTGTESNWIVPGTTMYWSHTDTPTYLQWFSSAGLTIIDTQFVPEGEGGHTLLFASKDR